MLRMTSLLSLTVSYITYKQLFRHFPASLSLIFHVIEQLEEPLNRIILQEASPCRLPATLWFNTYETYLTSHASVCMWDSRSSLMLRGTHSPVS